MHMNAQSFVVAGAGNTGSHVLPELVRLKNVARITLVDPQVYEEGNVAAQNIDWEDIGKPKVAENQSAS